MQNRKAILMLQTVCASHMYRQLGLMHQFGIKPITRGLYIPVSERPIASRIDRPTDYRFGPFPRVG